MTTLDPRAQSVKDIEACLDDAVNWLRALAGAEAAPAHFTNLRNAIEQARFYARTFLASPQPALAVKGLGEWRRGYCDEHVTIKQASTGFGSIYQVRVLDGIVWLDFPDQRKAEFGGNVEAAKAAAQADYETRIRSALVASPPPSGEVEDEPDFATSIAEIIKEESANEAACGWRSCTGCHETNEGAETGHYPYSKMFGCYVGGGCSECGGLGVVWEYWTKDELDGMLCDAALSIAPATADGWPAAYAAFVGAFDTPLARRRFDDEYAQDARNRLRDFNDAMIAAAPTATGGR